jgi:hypothetical protein
LPAVPAHAYSLAFLPRSDARTCLVNRSRDFVSWHARVGEARPRAHFFHDRIAVTDAARMNFDPDFSRPGLRYFALDDLEVCSRF